MDNSPVADQINTLAEHSKILMDLEDMPRLHHEYEQWYTQVSKLVADYLPTRLPDLRNGYAYISRYLIEHPDYPGVGSRIYYRTSLQQQVGILLSAKLVLNQNPKQPKIQDTIERICLKFHGVVGQLSIRHDHRQPFAVNDEYDVQDLFHALLRLHFDDIRPEEWTPSYAGGSSRMDFLLRKEAIVIEVKKTRKGLTEKELGEQLIIDIERYKTHPFCKQLVCFIYDPEERLQNPSGLENDLNRTDAALTVKIIINPKRH